MHILVNISYIHIYITYKQNKKIKQNLETGGVHHGRDMTVTSHHNHSHGRDQEVMCACVCVCTGVQGGVRSYNRAITGVHNKTTQTSNKDITHHGRARRRAIHRGGYRGPITGVMNERRTHNTTTPLSRA